MKQNKKQHEKLAFNEKLVAGRTGLADFIVGVHAGGNFPVMRVVRRKEQRYRDIAGEQRQKIVGVAGVRLFRNQNVRVKNDIFVFHGRSVGLSDGVQLPRKDESDGSCGDGVLREIDGNRSPAFFDIDNLHLVVPVNRDVIKVQRNGAQIGDVGEQRVPMWNFFLVIFIF